MVVIFIHVDNLPFNFALFDPTLFFFVAVFTIPKIVCSVTFDDDSNLAGVTKSQGYVFVTTPQCIIYSSFSGVSEPSTPLSQNVFSSTEMGNACWVSVPEDI